MSASHNHRVVSYTLKETNICKDVYFININESEQFLRGKNISSQVDVIIVNDASMVKEKDLENIKNFATQCLSSNRDKPFCLMLIH